MGFGWTELIIIFGIVLLLFGPKKLPQLAKNLGSSINVFKDELSKTTDSLEEGVPSNPIEEDPTDVATEATPEEETPEEG